MELNIPAIEGIGVSLIYLVDRYVDQGTVYDVDFERLEGEEERPRGVGLTYVDHLTHNVHRGRMDVWADFYTRLFNFREIRYFDIEGKLTGLKRSEEHTSELQSLMRISYAVFCLKKKNKALYETRIHRARSSTDES